VVVIQTAFRVWKARRRFQKQREAAILMQCMFRSKVKIPCGADLTPLRIPGSKYQGPHYSEIDNDH
jgi:hypothetical protein